MPGPSRYNRKLKARNDARKTAASKGGRTASEAAFGRSQKAAGRAVSATNLQAPKPKKVKAVRQPSIVKALQLPQVQDRIEKLREKYTPEGRTYQEAIRRDQGVVSRKETALDKVAAEQVKPSRAESRTDFLARQNAAKVNTTLSDDGASVERFRGQEIVGLPSIGAVKKAAREGTLGRQGKRLTTPQVRRVQGKVRRAKRELRKARNATRTPKKNLMRAGLDAEQAQVLATVLNVGRKRGATKKEMLAAVETAIQESGIRNLGYGDADSSGWRQERAMYYPTGKMGPQNVKASANRFFDESVTDANRGVGMTAGQLAQAIQASAYPDRYDERKGEAVPLLQAFNSAGNRSPKAKARLAKAEDQAARVSGRAAQLGLPGVTGSQDRYKGPLQGPGPSYPLAVKGELGATPADHANRAFGNWMSDNAVDISVPVGTPVRAVADAVVYKTSGSAPNHSANPAGWTVYLRDKNGEEYSYMHLEEYNVKAGQKVKAGQVIGASGAANSVPHLHFAQKNGDPVQTVSGGGGSKGNKPQFVNYSKKGGVGTSQTKWLVPTGGNEFMKFQRPLAEALVGLAKASGEPIQVNSAFRTRAEQEALYQAWQNGTGNLAAAPGTSNHEFGAAADVNLTARQRELAGQFGLGFPVSGEDWHIELVGDAANQIVSSAGVSGGSSYSAPTSGGTVTPSSGGGRGPASKKRRQTSVLEQLRKLGYNITSSGIRRSGLADSYDIEAPESISTIKSRYGVK